MARPSSATRALSASSLTSTRPRREGDISLCGDVGRQRALAADPVGDLLSGGPRPERADADAESNAGGRVDLGDVSLEARGGEFRAHRVGGLSRLVRADLHGEAGAGPWDLGSRSRVRPGRRVGLVALVDARRLRGLRRGLARPETAGKHAQHERGAEHREATEQEQQRGQAARLASASPRHHMLSGALTPRRSSPLRITAPTAAQSAMRACIRRTSAWITRWFLYQAWNSPASSWSQ